MGERVLAPWPALPFASLRAGAPGEGERRRSLRSRPTIGTSWATRRCPHVEVTARHLADEAGQRRVAQLVPIVGRDRRLLLRSPSPGEPALSEAKGRGGQGVRTLSPIGRGGRGLRILGHFPERRRWLYRR